MTATRIAKLVNLIIADLSTLELGGVPITGNEKIAGLEGALSILKSIQTQELSDQYLRAQLTQMLGGKQ